jgi:hypothetical protein
MTIVSRESNGARRGTNNIEGKISSTQLLISMQSQEVEIQDKKHFDEFLLFFFLHFFKI